MLALLWLDRDAAVWWQTVHHEYPTNTLAWEELKLLLKQQLMLINAAR